MSLRYCSLHGRLFSFTQQCWLPFPVDKIQEINAYAALLRATNTAAFSLTVIETSCDACAATVALQMICVQERDDEPIAFPQDQAFQDAESDVPAQEMRPLRYYARRALYESGM
jgi:hypothetical protein